MCSFDVLDVSLDSRSYNGTHTCWVSSICQKPHWNNRESLPNKVRTQNRYMQGKPSLTEREPITTYTPSLRVTMLAQNKRDTGQVPPSFTMFIYHI